MAASFIGWGITQVNSLYGDYFRSEVATGIAAFVAALIINIYTINCNQSAALPLYTSTSS